MKERLINIHYREEYTRSYNTRYIAEVSHTGLKEFKLFSANEKYILDNKINAHVAKMEEKWGETLEYTSFVTSKTLKFIKAENGDMIFQS